MKQQILTLRLGIIVILNSFPLIARGITENQIDDRERRATREKSMSFTSIQNAMMWTGKMLEYGTDDQNPYPDSSNPQNKNIEPTANTTEEDFLGKPNEETDFPSDYTLQIKYFRAEIEKRIQEVHSILASGKYPVEFQESARQVWKYLTEGKMQLGLELSNIRKNNN